MYSVKIDGFTFANTCCCALAYAFHQVETSNVDICGHMREYEHGYDWAAKTPEEAKAFTLRDIAAAYTFLDSISVFHPDLPWHLPDSTVRETLKGSEYMMT